MGWKECGRVSQREEFVRLACVDEPTSRSFAVVSAFLARQDISGETVTVTTQRVRWRTGLDAQAIPQAGPHRRSSNTFSRFAMHIPLGVVGRSVAGFRIWGTTTFPVRAPLTPFCVDLVLVSNQGVGPVTKSLADTIRDMPYQVFARWMLSNAG